MGEFSPYYQAGVKVSYAFNAHWSAQLHFLNGWQTIGDNNRAKAVGSQVAWSSERVSIAFNTFAGPELPSDDSHWRLFGDLIAQVKPTSWLSLGATADVGRQDRSGGAALWHGAALLARIAFVPRAALALRAEYYDDRDGFFSGTAGAARGHGDLGVAPGRSPHREARGAIRRVGQPRIRRGARRRGQSDLLQDADARHRQ